MRCAAWWASSRFAAFVPTSFSLIFQLNDTRAVKKRLPNEQAGPSPSVARTVRPRCLSTAHCCHPPCLAMNNTPLNAARLDRGRDNVAFPLFGKALGPNCTCRLLAWHTLCISWCERDTRCSLNVTRITL